MYHSISNRDAPISISPALFRDQMETLADCGCYGISIREYAAWRRGETKLPQKFVVLTFDDAYEDFAAHTYPELAARQWSATVFVPTGKIGRTNDWEAGEDCRLRLMDARTIAQLACAGLEFGAHGVTHRDLTGLSAAEARDEIKGARAALEDCIGGPVTSFAAPYGRTNSWLRDEISRHYQCAVGTSMRRADDDADLFDLPRIDMYYFRNPVRWRRFLRGGAKVYFNTRRLLRLMRAATLGP